jgi:hypothetical protein
MRARVFYDIISMNVTISYKDENYNDICFVPKDIWEDFVLIYNDNKNYYNSLLFKAIKPYHAVHFRNAQSFCFYIVCNGILPNYLIKKKSDMTEVEKEFKKTILKFVDIKFKRTLR